MNYTGCSRKYDDDAILSSKDEKDNILSVNQDDGHTLSEDIEDNTSIPDNTGNKDSKDIENNGYSDVNVDEEDKENKVEPITDDNYNDATITTVTNENNCTEDPVNSDVKEPDDSSSADVNKSKDNNQTDNSNNEQAESLDANKNQDIKEEQKLSVLGELSKKLALQMSNGEFKETHDTLSPLAKLQISLDVLEQGWKDTVADIGNYKSVREITEEASAKSTTVYVILDYDNSGIQVLFSYNINEKIDTLWINFAPYESVVDDNFFEEIKISFGDNKNPIEGILTLPKNAKKPPVAILVHGSGNHDADETIGVNKPFRDLAYGLARKGIAVIRYKENIPNSFDEFTIEDDSLNGASQAIKFAQSCGKVDTDNIIIVGHSLGGMMAPKIAADNKEIDGIVSLAGSPRRLEDIVLDQVKILNKADESITEAVYKLALAQANAQVKKIKELKESSAEIILGYPASYWNSLNQINTPSIVKDLDIPIYIAQGSEDFQVYADIDYIAWQELLKSKDNVTFRLYDNLNHLFMTTNGRMDVTEYNIKGTMEQKVIDDIAKWILKK